MKRAYVLVLFIFLFTAGCLGNSVRQASQNYVSEMQRYGLYTSVDLNGLTIKQEIPSCKVLVCEEDLGKRPWYIPPFLKKWFSDPSLVGGECRFEYVGLNNSSSFYEDLSSKDNFYVRGFDFGVYGSLRDYNDANAYCGGSLRYAVTKVKGNGNSYVIVGLPQLSSSCLLDVAVLPVYVFDNGGEVPQNDNSYELAQKLRDVGPVILITEHRPNLNPQNVNKIKAQAIRLKTQCPNCLVGVSIKLSDIVYVDPQTGKLNPLFEELLNDDQFNRAVDLIAFGADSRDLAGGEDCTGYGVAAQVLAAVNYVSKLLKKPSLIYYTFLRTGDGCYDAEDYAELYYSVFSTVNAFAQSGAMGFVASSFYPQSAEESCEDCAFLDGIDVSTKNEPAFSVFFRMCRDFYALREVESSTGVGNKRYMNVFPIALSTGLFDTCSLILPPPPKLEYFDNESVPRVMDYISRKFNIAPSDKEELFRCENCFTIGDYDDFPAIVRSLSSSFDSNYCDNEEGRTLDIFSSIYQIDSNFVKAYASAKTDFDQCYVAYVPRSAGSMCGWPSSLSSEEINNGALFDPSGVCSAKLQYLRNVDYVVDLSVSSSDPFRRCKPVNTVDPSDRGEKCVPCEFGIFGYRFPPTGNFPTLNVPPEVEKCGEDYNPYDIEDATCVFSEVTSLQYGKALEKVENRIEPYLVDLYDSDPSSLSKKELIEKHLATILLTAAYLDGQTLDRFIDAYQEIQSSLIVGGISCPSYSYKDILCCDEDTFDDKYGVCSTRMGFTAFVIKTRNSPLVGRENYPDFPLKVLAAYKDAYGECGSCFNEEWIDAVCKKMKKHMPPHLIPQQCS